jgi:hypothetical protein
MLGACFSSAFSAVRFQQCIFSSAFSAVRFQQCVNSSAFSAVHFQQHVLSSAFSAMRFEQCVLQCVFTMRFSTTFLHCILEGYIFGAEIDQTRLRCGLQKTHRKLTCKCSLTNDVTYGGPT